MATSKVYDNISVCDGDDYTNQLQIGHNSSGDFAFLAAFDMSDSGYHALRIQSSTDGSGVIHLGGSESYAKVVIQGEGTAQLAGLGIGLDTASVSTPSDTVTTCGSIATATGRTYAVEATAHGRKDEATKVVMFKRMHAFRNTSSTLTASATGVQTIGTDIVDGTAAAFTIDSSGTTIRFRVTGISGESWTWQVDWKVNVLFHQDGV